MVSAVLISILVAVALDQAQLIGGATPEEKIQVVNEVNRPPIARAIVSNQTVNENTLVTLNASNSIDPDGNITSYEWKQFSGEPIDISGANESVASFLAPNITKDSIVGISSMVRDNGNATAIDNLTILVKEKKESESEEPIYPGETPGFIIACSKVKC
jgi:hypothetical protein